MTPIYQRFRAPSPAGASGLEIPRLGVLAAVSLAALGWACAAETDDGHEATIVAHLAWQEERLVELRAEDGWLAVVGLAWLEEGEQTFGWGPGLESLDDSPSAPHIVLAEAPVGAPQVAGTIEVIETESGLRARLSTPDCRDCRTENGPPGAGTTQATATWSTFFPPPGEDPITLHAYGFELFVIERGGRLALRVRNTRSPRRAQLVSIPTQAYSPEWIVEGRFEAAEGIRELAIDNSTDHDYPQRSVGRFLFERNGESFAMELIGSDPDVPQLLMVGDASNGDTTYGGGRYLYVDVAGGGIVRADFNRLYNPPCVFTPWATCPLPSRSNRLPFSVPVGEETPIFVDGAK